jgi:photosystem II stability/assembly factor-like uncharacterized protein
MRIKIALLSLILVTLACGLPANTPLPSTATSSPATETIASPTETTTARPTLTSTPTMTTKPPTSDDDTVANPKFLTLSMIDPETGWAVTEQFALRTTDGGLTWNDLHLPDATAPGNNSTIFALDKNTAWILVADSQDPMHTGTLYRTHDGGLNWETISVPFGGGRLDFVDAAQGWMMLNLGVATGSMAVSIFRTEDGGNTWFEVYTNDPSQPEAGDSLPFGGIKNNLIAKDGQTAWVAGVIYAPETIYLFKSTDGGQTWAPQPLPAAPSTQNTEAGTDGPQLLSMSDAILPVHFSGETQRTGFYISHDGGDSWVFNTMMPGFGKSDFVSSADGFYWNGSQLFATVDGSATWNAINPNVDFGDSVFLMDFVDPQHGWIVTITADNQRILYATDNGGITWTQLTP